MLLLHISDIHFRSPECTTEMDPELPYRTSLLRDLRARVAVLGPVSAILVGGDIAYHGLPIEYKVAFQWLQELAIACGCPTERVFVVPGNHDIDRNVIKNSASVRNAQLAITSSPDGRGREREFIQQLRDSDAGRALFAPMAAYNAFAAKLNCQVYPDRPFWRQDVSFNARTTLRIYGLTSVLLSGAGVPRNIDDIRAGLYLSPYQTVLNPDDGVVNLVLCHHPPDWFLDGDDIEDAIQARSTIHMFGHKHRQRILRENSFVRFSAGAVNPDRHEPGWEPGYNLVQLSLVETEADRRIDMAAHLRRWQTNPDMFVAKLDGQSDVFAHSIRVPGFPPPNPGLQQPVPEQVSPMRTPMNSVTPEAAMGETTRRNLVLRFWGLSSSQRRDIALRLKLIEPDEMRLPEPERYGRALLRAGERGLLDQVAQQIEQVEKGHGRKQDT